MRIETRNGSGERQVLIGMLVSRAVLGPIAARWEANLFPSRYANLVGGWAVEHYRKYKRPPGRDIAGYLDAWAETGHDREVISAVESLLAGLSEEYERLKKSVSPDYILDQAAKLFNRNRLADLRERIESHLENGDVEKAEQLVERFRKVEIGLGAGIDVLTEEEAMQTAFENRAEIIVQLPDAVGNFFGPALSRDSLISFMGKEKIGKSFWLQKLAWLGVEQGRNVAYFEVGDMSQAQVLRRFAALAAGRPLNAGRYDYPTNLEPVGETTTLPIIRHERLECRRDLTHEEAIAAMAKVGGRVGGSRFKLSCHPNSSISVSGIEAILEGWERDGWAADVIVIDYADILAPLDGRAETRDQINATWKAMRALSQRRHCLVVTATQADADSYTAGTLGRDNFSEDKRKYSHVTGMVGINQNAKEKDAGIYRLNWIVLRELEFSERKCVYCAACLPIADPCVLSTF